jgi:hypothetical protein
MRILIVGGYGTFGGRLAELLKDEAVSIFIGGRSFAAAERFCANLRGRAVLTPLAFDRDGDLDAQLARIAPTLVVDASGPFQIYGAHPYRLIETCIERGIHYIDLADGADFVAGVAALDERARARGVFALSGVSSFPVLTAAVVRRLAENRVQIESVTAGIAPSPHAGVGLNVIRAIAGYGGAPIRLRRNGRDGTAFGLLEQRRMTIAPPGYLPLERRLFSLVDVPDLRALAEQHPHLRDVWVGAAPVPRVFHRMLIALCWLRRFRLLPSLTHIAALMHFVTRYFRWGPHRGGMFVTVAGFDGQNRRIAKTWFLIAEGDSGPFIPSMAAECVIRQVLAGARIPAGARTALQDIQLVDYEQLFAKHQIVTGVRTESKRDASLFERVLGDTWNGLPVQLRAMHEAGPQRAASGIATVIRGKGLIARLIGSIVGFPASATDIPITVSFDPTSTRERWIRRFGVRQGMREFRSELSAGAGFEEGLLIERFGPLSISLALVWEAPRLKFIVRGWRLGPIPLPLRLAPISETYESAEHDRFNFDVGISHPLAGLLVRYRGWLDPQ